MPLDREIIKGRMLEAYLSCVVNDEEFQTRAKSIRKKIEKCGSGIIEWKTDGGKITMTIADNEVSPVPQDIVKSIVKLARDFDISLGHVTNFLGYNPAQRKDLVRVSSRLNRSITITLRRGATKKDVLESIEDIDALIETTFGKSVRRVRGPENYQLVFAIHLSRKKGKKFSEIFEDYKNQRLDRYKGARQIISLGKFREYYHRYKPENKDYLHKSLTA
jgi:hypothetical protein